jgi:hypothetical protein
VQAWGEESTAGDAPVAMSPTLFIKKMLEFPLQLAQNADDYNELRLRDLLSSSSLNNRSNNVFPWFKKRK